MASFLNQLLVIFLLCLGIVPLYSQNNFYHPDTIISKSIPTPEQFLGYSIGDYFTRYDQQLTYFSLLSKLSDKVVIKELGLTNEKRKQVAVIVTSEENQRNLEKIRLEHLKSFDPSEKNEASNEGPVIVQMVNNVHGDELSGGEAAMLVAYNLAVGGSVEVERILNNSILLIIPSLNPDGQDRYTSWVNNMRGKTISLDPADLEHNQPWPTGRGNHYLIDLNRDWLLATQIESHNILDFFHQWKPNIVTDHHETYTYRTFFFEPSKPGLENPFIPEENYEHINNLFATQLSKEFDKMSRYYYSGRSYDNMYPGKASVYPDIHGGVGLLFEQAGYWKGLKVKTPLGNILSLQFGVRNQFVALMSTLETAVNNKTYLNDYKRRFYANVLKEAQQQKIKGYVFGDEHNSSLTTAFVDLLKTHDVDFYRLGEDIVIDGRNFKSGKAYVVPLGQLQYPMVQTMFKQNKPIQDSTYTGISDWALIHMYNLPYKGLSSLPKKSENTSETKLTFPKSELGYVIDWRDFNSAGFLNSVLSQDIKVKAAWDSFVIPTHLGRQSFSRGSIFIPVQYQDIEISAQYEIIQAAANEFNLSVKSITTSNSVIGMDMGDEGFKPVAIPKILMPMDSEVVYSETSAGELWFFLDQLGIPVVKTDVNKLTEIDLTEYNVVILPSSQYLELEDKDLKELMEWAERGGTLIAIKSAVERLAKSHLIDLKHKQIDQLTPFVSYKDISKEGNKHKIGGNFFVGNVDLSHPLSFGTPERTITIYKDQNNFFEPTQQPASNVVVYNPSYSGGKLLSSENVKPLNGSPAILSLKQGKGHVILFVDNPTFKATAFGTSKFILNAIFFGDKI